MATFMTLAKIHFFCNAKVAGLGEIYIQGKYTTHESIEEKCQT
jgi:hypothetical protein